VTPPPNPLRRRGRKNFGWAQLPRGRKAEGGRGKQKKTLNIKL